MKDYSLSKKASKHFEVSLVQKKKYIDGNNDNDVIFMGEKEKILKETFYTILNKSFVSLSGRKRESKNFYSFFNFLIGRISSNAVKFLQKNA